MRIAIVVPGGVGPDGVHDVVPALLSLVARLVRDHELLVVATDQVTRPASYRLRGARIVALGRLRRGSAGRLRVTRRAVAELRTFKPDVIHAIWLGPGSSIAVLAGLILRVPVVASIGGGELVWIPRIWYGGAGTWRGRAHARLALARAAAVTGGSAGVVEAVRRRRTDAVWLPLGAEPIEPSEASADQFEAGHARTPGDSLRIVVVGSVNRVKGPDVVLGAIARARDRLEATPTVAWIGEDTLGGSAAALAPALGVADIVTFRGFLEHRRVLHELATADVLVQGSYHESQGVAVLEAATAGVPTVGTATGLVGELAAADPAAAIAVRIGDAAALGDAIVDLARDPARRARLGAAARDWAAAHDADWTARAFETLYGSVARRTRHHDAGRA